MTGDDFSLGDFLPYLLNQAAEAASQSFAAIYKARYGMGRTEWRVLVHLGFVGEMTARDICQRTREHKTRVSRAVTRLEVAGRLTRRAHAHDRRQELLSLTGPGRAVYADLSAEAVRHDSALAEHIGAQDIARLKALLSRLFGPLQAERNRRPKPGPDPHHISR